MKYSYKLAALLCAMALWATSCTKETLDEPSVGPEVKGDEIVFGARAGFENGNPDSRTVYSGDTYKVGDATFERIDWVTGDAVEIYSPQAIGVNPAHYGVTQKSVDPDGNEGNSTGDQYDEGYLTTLSNGGLQWGSNEAHTFYAMYPSQGDDETLGIVENNNKVTINAKIPTEQNSQGAVTYDASGNVTNVAADIKRYELKPNMNYAFMVAKNEITPNKENASVSLDFVPIVTAIRVELYLPLPAEVSTANNQVANVPDTYIGGVQLTGKGIAGAFTANLTNWDKNQLTYPTCTNDTADAEKTQAIWMQVSDNENNPILLKPGQTLAFTFFVRPGADLNVKELVVSFGLDQLSLKNKSLGKDAVITKMTKTSLKGLKLPYTKSDMTLTYSNWVSQLLDETTMIDLSLPGTGGSFSYAYEGGNSNRYMQQTHPVFTNHELDKPAENETNAYYGKTGQWDMGIRAFEIACDRPSNPATSLGGQPIRVNKQSMGDWTVGEAIEAVLDKVIGTDETAMIILTYQCEGQSGLNRNAYAFARSLQVYYNSIIADTYKGGKYKGKMILYSPDTKLGTGNDATDARGKVMIVCRINQRDEPEADYGEHNELSPSKTTAHARNNFLEAAALFTDGTVEYDDGSTDNISDHSGSIPILLIDGCGTAKDRWGARGYGFTQTDGTKKRAFDIQNGSDPESVDYYLVQYSTGTAVLGSPTYGDWYDWTKVIKPTAKEDMAFNFKTDEGYEIWYQDWARVVPASIIDQTTGYYLWKRSDWRERDERAADVRWFESYSEKVNAVKWTFDKAISQTDATANKMVFINSLCGYYVDTSIELSYTPMGNHTAASWSGGTEGDILGLANDLNEVFGAYVRGIISSSAERGSTGVVLMDYVSSETADGARYYLPSVLISNNLYTGNADPDKVVIHDIDNPDGGDDGTGEEG